MNGTVIDIPGIHVSHEIINMEDSTDTAHVIVIKDDYGKEVRIVINFGKIIETSCKGQ